MQTVCTCLQEKKPLAEVAEWPADANTLQILLQGKKRRKQVDRRASKGRKLRFHVQDKLVSFMSPVEAAADAMAPKLFTNLFGVKA